MPRSSANSTYPKSSPPRNDDEGPPLRKLREHVHYLGPLLQGGVLCVLDFLPSIVLQHSHMDGREDEFSPLAEEEDRPEAAEGGSKERSPLCGEARSPGCVPYLLELEEDAKRDHVLSDAHGYVAQLHMHGVNALKVALERSQECGVVGADG